MRCRVSRRGAAAAWRRELLQSAYSPALLTRGSDLFLVLSATSSEHYFGIAFLRKSANSKLFLSGVYSCAELAGGERGWIEGDHIYLHSQLGGTLPWGSDHGDIIHPGAEACEHSLHYEIPEK